jgi:hypothetical protein
LNAEAERNACEPSRTRSTPAKSGARAQARTVRRRYVGAQTQRHRRAYKSDAHVGASLAQTGIGDPFLQLDTTHGYRYICIYHVYKHHVCACSMDAS